MAAVVTSHVLCFLYSLPGPPLLHVQNFSLTLYPTDRKYCSHKSPDSDVDFHLYTRKNPTKSQVLNPGNDSLLLSSNINFDNPTVLFFHGFTESLKTDDSQLIKRSFLQAGDYNVILTNAERLLAGLYYVDAVNNCKYIGQYAAKFVDYLITKGLDLSTLHVIGMSLGAQIAGFVGQYLTLGRLPRITGLDPAGPLYNGVPINERLDPSDAEFVDVIHSNQGVFGIKHSCGHVDFWPNGGGPSQPGCSLTERLKTLSLNELVFCEHFRAHRLFARSLSDPYRYLAAKCDNYTDYKAEKCSWNGKAFMGIAVAETTRGNYFIETGKDASGYGQ